MIYKIAHSKLLITGRILLHVIRNPNQPQSYTILLRAFHTREPSHNTRRLLLSQNIAASALFRHIWKQFSYQTFIPPSTDCLWYGYKCCTCQITTGPEARPYWIAAELVT